MNTLEYMRKMYNVAVGGLECAIVVALLGAISFGFYEWVRPGAVHIPALPKHVFVSPSGFVVQDGYEYLKYTLCHWRGEGSEPKLESVPGGYKLILCEGEEPVDEKFKYTHAQEWKE